MLKPTPTLERNMVAGLFSGAAYSTAERQVHNLGSDILKQLMVDNLRDCGLVLLDTEGKVLSWNAGAKGLLGYEEADAVGQPFARIVPPATLDASGTPVSLAKARRHGRHEEICQRMRRDGTGLEVREVVIPLRDPQHNLVAFGLMMQSLEAAREAATRPVATPAPRARKVLLVDDEEVVRVTAQHQLEDLGYEVLSAASGEEALDILARDESIDVLFTDVIMPGMNGGQVAEEARTIRPDLRILFTSGYFEHALVERGNIKPNANLLVKPYQRRELCRMMNRILAADVRHAEELAGPGDAASPPRDAAVPLHARR